MAIAESTARKASSTANPVMARIMAYIAAIKAFVGDVEHRLELARMWVESWDIWMDFDESTPHGYAAAQSQTVIQGVVIVVVASIGVVIVDNIDTSLGNISNSDLNTSQDNLLTGFGNMIDLIEPLLIVLIAVVVIAVIQRVRA